MKYHEIERNGNKLLLDYVTPKWCYPLLIIMSLGFIGTGVYLVAFAGAEWYMLVIVVIAVLILYMYLVQFTKKRPIVIDYDASTISYDSVERSLSAIKEIMTIVNLDSIKKGIADNNAPGLISSKQKFTTFETFIVFNNGDVLRVYFGTMRQANAEADKFEKYLSNK